MSTPTVEEFLKERATPPYAFLCENIIEFTKMHVENAKKEYERIILQEGLVTEAGVAYLDNAYPLDLIK